MRSIVMRDGTRWLGIGGVGGLGIGLVIVGGGTASLLGSLLLGIAVCATVFHARAHAVSDDRRVTRHPRGVTDGGDRDIELVVAIIRPGKLTAVKRALAEAGTPSLTVTNVSGRGTQPTETGRWRGEEYIVDLHQKVKVECAVVDDSTETVVDAIQGAAHTGEAGDGKIFVFPILDACRVSTNERGIEAM